MKIWHALAIIAGIVFALFVALGIHMLYEQKAVNRKIEFNESTDKLIKEIEDAERKAVGVSKEYSPLDTLLGSTSIVFTGIETNSEGSSILFNYQDKELHFSVPEKGDKVIKIGDYKYMLYDVDIQNDKVTLALLGKDVKSTVEELV